MQPFLHRVFTIAFRIIAVVSALTLVSLSIAVTQEMDRETIVALTIITLASLGLLFFTRRCSWFFSAEGRRHRQLRIFEEHKKKVVIREEKQREKLSQKSSLRNIRECIETTKKELYYRRKDVTPNILSQVNAVFTIHERENNIDAVVDIYNLVTQVEANLLNEKLGKLVTPISTE
jgi:hypothetical protein